MPLTHFYPKSLPTVGFQWTGILPLLAFLLLGASTQASADSTATKPVISQDEKLDSVLSITREIRKEVRPQNPFEDKSWGIELNPLSILFANEALALYGGIQQFSWDRGAEWSFPFQFLSNDNNKAFVVDAHYRFFLGEAQKGFM